MNGSKNPNIMVSVICNAYNHEPYIRQCLESLVCQITDFNYEILVHDDASTDKTAEIIKEFEELYPDLIKPIYQTENQYSKGGIAKFQYSRVSGKYIAFCEGDDYWTDDNKLQIQFDSLEKHPEIDICAHGAIIINALDNRQIGMVTPRKEDTIINPDDVIYGDGGFVATNSLMYRSNLNNKIPMFRKMLNMDYTIQIHGSLKGGMLYVHQVMSAYRYAVPASWTKRILLNEEKRGQFEIKKHKMLLQLDKDTSYLYHDIIQKRIKRDKFECYGRNRQYKEMLKQEYKEFFSEMPLNGQIRVFVLSVFPWLKPIKDKLLKYVITAGGKHEKPCKRK